MLKSLSATALCIVPARGACWRAASMSTFIDLMQDQVPARRRNPAGSQENEEAGAPARAKKAVKIIAGMYPPPMTEFDDAMLRASQVEMPRPMIEQAVKNLRGWGKEHGQGIEKLSESAITLERGQPMEFPYTRAALKAAESDPLSAKMLALSYMARRLPGIHAAILRSFIETAKRLPSFEPKTLLHYGAAYGEGFFAAGQTWPTFYGNGTAVEPIAALRHIGQSMTHEIKGSIKWGPMLDTIGTDQSDLVVSSFVLASLTPADRMRMLDKLWDKTKEVLVIVEPGTPDGFDLVTDARAHLLSQDKDCHVAAPCPHSKPCPMLSPSCKRKEWCHMRQRAVAPAFQRTAMHKPGSFNPGQRDMKFSYVVLAKGSGHFKDDVLNAVDGDGAPAERMDWGRLIKDPMLKKKHLILSVCTAAGNLERRTVAKSHGEKGGYRKARDSSWGDVHPHDPSDMGFCEKVS